MHDEILSVREEWRRGWSTVFAAAFGVSAGVLVLYSAGAFIGPIEADTGWSRTQIGSGLTVVTICSTLTTPFIGAVIDRYGARRIALAAIVLFPSAFAAIGLTGSEIWQWWLAWGVVGLFAGLMNPTTWTAAVMRWFDRSRGLALAFALSGTGVGSLLIPILTTYFIEHFGWRMAFAGLGLIWAGIGLPIVYFMLRDRPIPKTAAIEQGIVPETEKSIWHSLLSRQFIALFFAVLFFTFVAICFIVSIIPILRSQGMGAEAAAGLASMFGISTIVGRLTTGFMLDRLNPRLVTAVAMGIPIIATLLLWAAPGVVAAAAIAILVMGFALGAEVDAIAYLTSRYFSTRHYALLFGTAMSSSAIASSIAPLVSGLIYDLTGGYSLLLLILIFPCAISVAAIISLGRQPDKT